MSFWYIIREDLWSLQMLFLDIYKREKKKTTHNNLFLKQRKTKNQKK